MKTVLKNFSTFSDFYLFYLSEHKDSRCRRLHFFGSLCIVGLLLPIIFTHNWLLLFFLPIIGYGFAWLGHFVYEKNAPATFKYPLYSFMGDWVMFKDILIRKIKF